MVICTIVLLSAFYDRLMAAKAMSLSIKITLYCRNALSLSNETWFQSWFAAW